MQIGEVAERVGLSLRTIRFYEEAGLVIPAARSVGGFRLYSESDIERLLLIMKLKPLDFSVDEIGKILSVLDDLVDESGTDADRTMLLGELASYQTMVDSRIAKLSARLAAARELSTFLRDAIDAG